MGSKIEWTNKTWNPTTGCSMYSSSKNGGNECLNCYAEKETKRLMLMGQEKYKHGFHKIVEHSDSLAEPYKWKNPATIFVNSMSDLFHKDVSDEFIKKVFQVMNDNQQHTFQILTKRNDRIDKLPNDLIWTNNIWLGVSCGNQYATKRISALVKSPAKHRFLSIEPFIQEITEINLNGINWVIVGGESGNNTYQIEKDETGREKFEIINNKLKYNFLLDENGSKNIKKEIRPMKKEWVEFIKDQCMLQKVPFFFKQWGKKNNNPDLEDATTNLNHRHYSKGGCQLDGKVYWANPTVPYNLTPTLNLFGKDHLIMDQIEDLVTIWELKSHLPFAEKDLFENLKQDIKKNDLNSPILYIVVNDLKLVIEGHTRLSALIALKKKDIPTKEILETFNSVDEIKLWMVRHQLSRRNLTIQERVRLAFISKATIEILARANLIKAGQVSSKNGAAEKNIEIIRKIDTHAEIAKIANVSKTTIVSYAQILKDANKTTIEKLSKGLISIGAAHASLNKKPKAVNAKPTKKENRKGDAADKASTIVIFESIEIGKQKIDKNEVDVLIICKNNIKSNALMKKLKCNVGLYYLP
jgi:protein gp37/ParB-like chromosome segregation protein Spo0J